jgi:uncharacterized membrane protein
MRMWFACSAVLIVLFLDGGSVGAQVPRPMLTIPPVPRIPLPPTVPPVAPTAGAAPPTSAARAAPRAAEVVVQWVIFEACNQSGEPISVAVAYPASGGRTAEGWWTVADGKCRQIGTFPLQHRSFAYHATAASRRWWGTSETYCVNLYAEFTLDDAARSTGDACPNGYQLRKFRPIGEDVTEPGPSPSQRRYRATFVSGTG